MADRFFTPEYVERVTLRDNTVVLLRLVAPEDRELLRRGFERWSPQSRYARFLVPKQRLTDDELEYLCDVDQENHFALGAVAEAGDGHGEPIGLGIARFIVVAPPPGEPREDRTETVRKTAEAAIAVADEVQGRGLGKLLFLRLCAAAAERGVQEFACEVLCDNHAMQHMLEHIAPTQTKHVEAGVTSVRFEVAPFAPDAPVTTDTGGPMYRLLRAAAQNAIEWTAAVRRLWRRG